MLFLKIVWSNQDIIGLSYVICVECVLYIFTYFAACFYTFFYRICIPFQYISEYATFVIYMISANKPIILYKRFSIININFGGYVTSNRVIYWNASTNEGNLNL